MLSYDEFCTTLTIEDREREDGTHVIRITSSVLDHLWDVKKGYPKLIEIAKRNFYNDYVKLNGEGK